MARRSLPGGKLVAVFGDDSCEVMAGTFDPREPWHPQLARRGSPSRIWLPETRPSKGGGMNLSGGAILGLAIASLGVWMMRMTAAGEAADPVAI